MKFSQNEPSQNEIFLAPYIKESLVFFYYVQVVKTVQGVLPKTTNEEYLEKMKIFRFLWEYLQLYVQIEKVTTLIYRFI